MKKFFLIAAGSAALFAGLPTGVSAGYCGCRSECQRRCAVDVRNGVETSQSACERKWAAANVAAGRVQCGKKK